jgi:hypothetical protein
MQRLTTHMPCFAPEQVECGDKQKSAEIVDRPQGGDHRGGASLQHGGGKGHVFCREKISGNCGLAGREDHQPYRSACLGARRQLDDRPRSIGPLLKGLGRGPAGLPRRYGEWCARGRAHAGHRRERHVRRTGPPTAADAPGVSTAPAAGTAGAPGSGCATGAPGMGNRPDAEAPGMGNRPIPARSARGAVRPPARSARGAVRPPARSARPPAGRSARPALSAWRALHRAPDPAAATPRVVRPAPTPPRPERPTRAPRRRARSASLWRSPGRPTGTPWREIGGRGPYEADYGRRRCHSGPTHPRSATTAPSTGRRGPISLRSVWPPSARSPPPRLDRDWMGWTKPSLSTWVRRSGYCRTQIPLSQFATVTVWYGVTVPWVTWWMAQGAVVPRSRKPTMVVCDASL